MLPTSVWKVHSKGDFIAEVSSFSVGEVGSEVPLSLFSKVQEYKDSVKEDADSFPLCCALFKLTYSAVDEFEVVSKGVLIIDMFPGFSKMSLNTEEFIVGTIRNFN